MWVHINLGVGNPGKLWTGADLSGTEGKYALVELVEFHSPASGASTRRLFFRETRDEPPEGIVIPTLLVATGGVGSIGARYFCLVCSPSSRDVYSLDL
jgi:hypothetical protein